MTVPQFFNSAVMRAPERLLLRGGAWRWVSVGVRYGVIVHPELGPVLIDTGYGPRATEGDGRSLALRVYGAVLRPRLVPEDLPLAVLARLGFRAEDVRRIVVTHFHADHVAGLKDFPRAQFVASGAAWKTIEAMGPLARHRHGVFGELLPEDFGARLLAVEDMAERSLPHGLGVGRDILGDGLCLTVDLPGHALGHFGVVWPEQSLLYAVDTTWLGAALAERLPRGPARLVYADGAAMAQSARRVRGFAEAGGEVVLCHERVKA